MPRVNLISLPKDYSTLVIVAQGERLPALGGIRLDKIIIIDPRIWLQVLTGISQRVLAKKMDKGNT